MWVYFWTLFCPIDPQICFLQQYHVVDYYSFGYYLKFGGIMPPALFFFFRIALAILDLLWFHVNFRIISSSSVKNVIGNLIGITLSLQVALGCMVILTVLLLPIQERGISLHFLESSSKSFTSLVRFIPRVFFFFGCDVKQQFFFFLFLIYHSQS